MTPGQLFNLRTYFESDPECFDADSLTPALQLMAEREKLLNLLKHLDAIGGLGLNVHAMISTAIQEASQ